MREPVLRATATGARRIESPIPAGELRFRRLLEALPAGAYICDAEGLITYFNQHALDIWGRAPKLNDPVDRFCGSFRLLAVDGSPIAHDQCWMALALQKNEQFNGQEIVIERPDGRRVTVLAHANPIHDESGQLLGAVNVLVDITDRKRAEDALKLADRTKNEFLATLAHELRNPLAPISNAVQVLHLQSAISPELEWPLGVIDRQLRQMTRLIDDLLDIARITGNKLELRPALVKLADVLHLALETSRPLIEARGHELMVSLPPEPVLVRADLTRLAQVVSNLLNNAARYTDRGGRVWISAERQGSDAVIAVRDSGIGISPAMLPRIFEMFAQANDSQEKSRGGLGIGLTLVKRLVELHGGSVSAKSAGPGLGSEFIVRIPTVVESVARPIRSRREPRGSVQAPALRIAIVDDNRDSAQSLRRLLALAGNDVRTGHNGVEAVQLAESFRPEVMLLDIGLPEKNGYEAARAIRERPWATDMILIAMTGWGQESDRNRSREAGFDHHLVKPVDPVELMQLLASVKQKARRRNRPR